MTDKNGNIAFVLAKQHHLDHFIKCIPKWPSVQLYQSESLRPMTDRNTQESIC